jgi:hypothetical protein
MVHDVIGDMEVVSVFDEHPAGFAPARVAAEGNVRLKIRDGAVVTIEGLLLDRLEEELHRLLEPSTSTGGGRLHKPTVKIFCHPIQTRGRTVRMWVMNGVHDNVGDIVYTAIVHVVGEIVKMEKPVEEIAANAQLGVAGIGVAHCGESPTLETVKGTTSSSIEVGVAVEQPPLRLDGDELVVPVHVEVERAMRDEIRK